MQFFKNIKRFTTLNNEPLSKISLLIIIFLDIFILSSIYNGLYEHTKQLKDTSSFIPQYCREIVINESWNQTNRIDKLSNEVFAIRTDYNNRYNKGQGRDEINQDIHPACQEFGKILKDIKDDKNLIAAFEERNKNRREMSELENEIVRLKSSYDTSLLETIAKKDQEQPNISAIKTDIQAKTSLLNNKKISKNSLEEIINNSMNVKIFYLQLDTIKTSDRDTLKKHLSHLEFYQPLKWLGMQLIFLLPLLFVFYRWNSYSIKKEHSLQTLMSCHLVVITCIPILSKTLQAVYYIIPKTLLTKLFALLVSLKLLALWYYLIIAIGIVVALFLARFFQKKFASKKPSFEEIMQDRISKGNCQNCGKHLNDDSCYCHSCGFKQVERCDNCGRDTFVNGIYCDKCGEVL